MNKILNQKKTVTLIFLLLHALAYSQFVTTGTATTTNLYTGGSVGVGYTTLPTFGTNKFMVSGNSLFTGTTAFTGNTTISGTSQVAYLGLGVAANSPLYRLNVSGDSYFSGNAQFTGRIGLGSAPSTTLTTKLLLASGTDSFSGLQFANLNANFSPTINTSKVLTVNTEGVVVLANLTNPTTTVSNALDVNNNLTTTVNGVSSSPLFLRNIFNSDGQINSDRYISTGTYSFRFYSSNFNEILFNPTGNELGGGSIHNIRKTFGPNVLPNLNRDGISNMQFDFNKSIFRLTQGISTSSSWLQSNTTNSNGISLPFDMVLNPLGGNIGINLGQTTVPTAQFHTKGTLRFENLDDAENPFKLLGTDDNGNVFEYDPSQFSGGTSQDAWLLNGNMGTSPGTLAGQNFIGTQDLKDLVFGVNTEEKIRIKPSGRIQFFGWTPANGANSAYNMFIGGGNDTSSVGNIALGVGSMINNTTGVFNTALGFSALENNTTGFSNTAIGFQSMRMNTTGNDNVSVGNNSLFTNTTGVSNNAHGNSSLFSNTTGSNNNAFGFSSLYTNTTGASNNAYGNSSLFSNTTGSNNNAFGLNSLNKNTIGASNNAYGNSSLFSNTTGSNNNAFGFSSLYTNTTGASNNAYGNSSLFSNTTGSNNNAFGLNSLYTNTTGTDNNAFGLNALLKNSAGRFNNAYGNGSLQNNTASNNNAFGYNSLNKNTTGSNNNAFGLNSLYTNTTGASNNAYGNSSLFSNTTGSNNNAFGLNSLNKNTTGASNNAYGNSSLLSNTTGSNNNAFGLNSLNKNTSGTTNNAYGNGSLQNNIIGSNNSAFGNNALLNTTGANNVAIGNDAGSGNTSGSNNIFIGNNTQSPIGNTTNNQLNIGNWIYGYNGKIAIGSFTNLSQAFTTNADYQLFVKQGIRTEKVRVDLSNVNSWADYVFKKEYDLMPLNELEKYIVKNGHLPNIPKAEEVVKEGIDLGEMNSKLLEKIEELTLHAIELNKKNESQQKTIDNLIQRLEQLEQSKK